MTPAPDAAPAGPSPIPPRAHFVWLGPRLSALAYVSVRAALDRAGLDEVVLHYDTPVLAETAPLADLAARDGFRAAPLDVRAFAEADAAVSGGLDAATWDRLIALDALPGLTPAIRSDLHRLEILWLHGGIYLDTDAVVLADLRPLLADAMFCGTEQICFPKKVKGGLNPLRWAQGGLLTALRASVVIASRHPSRPFQRIAPLYFHEPMGAVCGAAPRHPLVRRLIERAASLPDRAARTPNRLGPWLFQEVLGRAPQPGLRRHAPHAFYPFPPEVSVDYMRPDPAGALGDRPFPETVVAHLWDSVMKAKLGHAVGPDDLRAMRHTTLVGRMTEPYLDDLFRVSGAMTG